MKYPDINTTTSLVRSLGYKAKPYQYSWFGRLLYKIYKQPVCFVGKTIRYSIGGKYSIELIVAMILHEIVHILQRKRLGLFSYWKKYWFSRKGRLELEIEAYTVNLMVTLWTYGNITMFDIVQLRSIMMSKIYFRMVTLDNMDEVEAKIKSIIAKLEEIHSYNNKHEEIVGLAKMMKNHSIVPVTFLSEFYKEN